MQHGVAAGHAEQACRGGYCLKHDTEVSLPTTTEEKGLLDREETEGGMNAKEQDR